MTVREPGSLLTVCTFTSVPNEEKKKKGLANTFGVPLEWAREFRLPITDCCLPSARPQRPLLSLDPQTEPGCAAGMDCSGMHNSADKARTFQKESRVFHPLVCFNCIALHLLPQTMREKTEKLGEIEEMSGRCFWDGPDKCHHNRASHFSVCLLAAFHEGEDGAWLIILEFSFSGCSRVSVERACVCACLSDIFAPTYVPDDL